jgi:hypothetical protein
MHTLSPADELAELRADIHRLKLLEAALRTKILAAPDKQSVGRWHRIEVQETKSRILDANLLPADIRDDPRFYRDRIIQVVRVLPVQAKRPGWPIQRDQNAARTPAFH